MVVTKIEWYCDLIEHLLEKTDDSFGTTMEKLEEKVLELYKAILLYQMQSVCYYYRHQDKTFGRAVLDMDNWDDMRNAVKDAEDDLMKYWNQYNQVKADHLRTRLKNITGNMAKDIGTLSQTMRDWFDQQMKSQKTDDINKCLKALFVVNPGDRMSTIKEAKGGPSGLIKDACEWIFENEKYSAFTNWDESTSLSHRLLWIKGPAGTGKTMLLIGIIGELLKLPAATAPKPLYFFCQGNDTKVNNATATIKSLIRSLIICQQPLFEQCLKEDFDNSGASVFEGTDAMSAMTRVFKNMVKDAGMVYIIVDALDECEQLPALISLISNCLAFNNVRWLVSSRPEVDLLNKVKKNLNKDYLGIAETLVELNIEGQNGVHRYIDYKLRNLRNLKRYEDDDFMTVEKKVRAEDNFLWLHLVFEKLENTKLNAKEAIKNIKDYPAGLDELYKYKMTRIADGDLKLQQHLWDILFVASLVYRPLSVPELGVLVPWSAKNDPDDIIEKCDSFLTFTDETFSLVHKSANDYLHEYLRTQKSEPRNEAAQKHADIVKFSTRGMQSILIKNVCKLQHEGVRSKDIAQSKKAILAPIQYSCVFWLYHLRDAIKDNIQNGEVCSLGFEFLKKHFLYWLESLSLLHRLSDGMISIKELLKMAQVR